MRKERKERLKLLTMEAEMKEKRRLKLSVMGIIVCGVLIATVQWKAHQAEKGTIDHQPSVTEIGAIMTEPDAEILARIDHDSNTLEVDAFDEITAAGRALGSSWLYILGEPAFPFEDGQERAAELTGKPFRLRGHIGPKEFIKRTTGANRGDDQTWWLMRSDEGHLFYYIDVTGEAEIPNATGYVMADGFFLKYYAESLFEGFPDRLPVFLGNPIRASFKLEDPITQPDLGFLNEVRDHPLGTHNDALELNADPYMWHLANVAKNVSLDPELLAEVTKDPLVLDETTIEQLVQTPDIFRGRMFQLGGLVRESSTVKVGENPIRERDISSAWIRNDLVGDFLTHLKAPGTFHFGANEGPIIYHGYFLMLWAYETGKGQKMRSPVFVVVDAKPQEKVTPPFAGQAVMGFMALAIALGLFLVHLARKDKMANAAQMEKLQARRDARRS